MNLGNLFLLLWACIICGILGLAAWWVLMGRKLTQGVK